MTPSQKRNLLFVILAAGALVVVIASIIAVTGSRRDLQVAAPAGTDAPAGGFSFFNVDRTTVLTHDLRETLAETLGSDAIARSTTIDLTVVSREFLRDHLPEIAVLQRGFNPPLGERREHETTRLTYRWAERHQMPFRHIELLFSNRTGRPLYFVIQPTEAFSDSVATLTAKYGPPRKIAVDSLAEPARIWEQDGDILVATTIVRRNGRLSQELHMYFVDNLTRLLESEIESRRRERQDTRDAGERAF